MKPTVFHHSISDQHENELQKVDHDDDVRSRGLRPFVP